MNLSAAYFQWERQAPRYKPEGHSEAMPEGRELKRIAPRRGADNGQLAVVVHGLFMYGHFMIPLGNRLAEGGYETLIYDYPTRRRGIESHGGSFADYLGGLARRSGKRINIVTHSLGGVVTRVALSRLLEGGALHAKESIGRVVMLAPPHKGSDVAKLLSLLPFAGAIARPLPELSSHPGALVHRLPSPEGVDIGIIAGRRDSEVAVEYTHMPGERAHTVIDSDHTFMPYRRDVANAVLRYLERGEF